MVTEWIHTLQQWNVLFPLSLLLLTALLTPLILARFFGVPGLYGWLALALITANIQVLKVIDFPFFPDPVAMGTILFSSTFFVTDLIAEHYSRRQAHQAVWFGFTIYLAFVLIMILTAGVTPLNSSTIPQGYEWALAAQPAIETLFLPAPALFTSGMIAYLISQQFDIYLFHFLKNRFDSKHLWLRNNLSTLLSSLIDNTIFSILAWRILAEHPVAWKAVVFTYIFGTWVLRAVVALLDTPFLYLARGLLKKAPKHVQV